MAYRAVRKKVTPRSCHYNGVEVSTVRRDYRSITQAERERARRENFLKGSTYAGVAMVALFVFLSVGCVVWGW